VKKFFLCLQRKEQNAENNLKWLFLWWRSQICLRIILMTWLKFIGILHNSSNLKPLLQTTRLFWYNIFESAFILGGSSKKAPTILPTNTFLRAQTNLLALPWFWTYSKSGTDSSQCNKPNHITHNNNCKRAFPYAPDYFSKTNQGWVRTPQRVFSTPLAQSTRPQWNSKAALWVTSLPYKDMERTDSLRCVGGWMGCGWLNEPMTFERPLFSANRANRY
jgi:hypothetical protein